MNNTLLIAKNEFEGIASAILLNVALSTKLDIKFYKYETETSHFCIDEHNSIIVVGLKNANKLKETIQNKTIKVFNSFEDVYDYCIKNYSNVFETYKLLEVFCNHAKAYLNWSWQENKLYYGKNIDELSKYFNKVDLVKDITNKIINYKDIISELEKQIIIFSKKIMTNYIEKKKYFVIEKGTHRYAYAFCEMNEIELANKIIDTEKVDAVILANLNNNIVRIKTPKRSEFDDKIINMDGHINSNGGTLKLSNNTVKKIHELVFTDIINSLEEGE